MKNKLRLKKGFTIIELIVVVAILGILVLLAGPRLLGYVEKARIARIKNDIKATENVMASKIIDDEHFIDNWENISNTELQEFAEQDGLYDKKGNLYDEESKMVRPVIPGNYKKIEKEEIKDQLKSGLPGDFYINGKGGEVYYYEENVKGNTSTPDENVEVDPPLTEEEIDDLVKNYNFIPVANADELNQIRPANDELTWGAGTKWEGQYTGTMKSKYVQVLNIDLSEYSEEGWAPIGNYDSRFTGFFDGNGYSITGLKINRPETDYVGLFGYTSKATIENVALEDINVTGSWYVGGLVGYANQSSTITNSYATGSVEGTGNYTGGLVGLTDSSTAITTNTTITNSYATGAVMGKGERTGGLVGQASNSTITNSHAIGSVSGSSYTGGLVGLAGNLTIENSHATGSVTGSSYTGGLVGWAIGSINHLTEINNSYATGEVTGISNTGGLVGYTSSSTTISNSYATGSVSGTERYIGGLVGSAWNSSKISNSYATGSVEGTGDNVGGFVGFAVYSTEINNSYATGSVEGTGNNVGGLVGRAYESTIINSYAIGEVTGTSSTGGLAGVAEKSTVTNSYWDKDTTGRDWSAEGEGKSTIHMKDKETYTNWDFDEIWQINEGQSYPTLR